MAEAQATPTLNIILPETGLPPAHPVNHFHMAFAGTDIELTLFFVDLSVAIRRRDVAQTAGTPRYDVEADAAARVVMSKVSFKFLLDQMQDIWKRWEIQAE